MLRHHYPGLDLTAVRVLRQVAEIDGRWLALLGRGIVESEQFGAVLLPTRKKGVRVIFGVAKK